ncbi:RNA-binding protein [Candidatus Fermentibacteria bacterium]|nr:RNA-binding protein [Candidatus Fermentibacteria bacterium]
MGREPRQGVAEVSNSKLFVGGLAWATTDEALQRAFSAHGEVTESRVVMDRTTGRSRGFGFVTFAASDSALKAKNAMDNAVLDGRNIRVDFATERERS